ncbi:MBL fold metallo-hydrolase [Luedemannella helvata]|uniref:MBL fold metallo-hydrolase n=1 Tax=Luedemannella helvata TaxID=349315 RepID=A0ABP4WIM5_9ACTN
MVGHVSVPAAAVLAELPTWAALVRADNPGPMTLDGTNSWVLRADPASPCLIVDPGPDDGAHLAALAARSPVAGILVTHGHSDHVAGLGALVRSLGGDVAVLAAGAEPASVRAVGRAAGFDLDMLPTPGHTADSVCFVTGTGERSVVLTGDSILGRGTTIVAYPDGDLGAYLASLERLTDYDGVPALPGHGPALADCAAAARFYVAHRHARLDEVRAAVGAGARTPEDVVAVVYRDVPTTLWPAAAWSVRAQLAYLGQEDGQQADGRESAPPLSRLDPP